MTEQADSLAAKLAPYRENPGIVAALLISRDGFLVAADRDESFAAEAVAAQVAGAIDVGARLAGELRAERATLHHLRTRRPQRRARAVQRRAAAGAGRPSRRARLRVPPRPEPEAERRHAVGHHRRPTRRRATMEDAAEQLENWRGPSASAPSATSSSPAGSAPSPAAATRTARSCSSPCTPTRPTRKRRRRRRRRGARRTGGVRAGARRGGATSLLHVARQVRAAQRLRRPRAARPRSRRTASRFLSRELSITTPHYVAAGR